jgi:hypothetical protein
MMSAWRCVTARRARSGLLTSDATPRMPVPPVKAEKAEKAEIHRKDVRVSADSHLQAKAVDVMLAAWKQAIVVPTIWICVLLQAVVKGCVAELPTPARVRMAVTTMVRVVMTIRVCVLNRSESL